MIKTSSVIPFQLPGFIRDDDNYQTFISFLQAYYEWMEQENGVLFEQNKILDYIDIDNTLDEFIDYFYNSFLPSFPVDVVTDKRKLLKFSKELYENKGNRASFKFLFRALYNSDSDIIETKEFVLKCSAGKWFLPKSIKIKSNDSRWINTDRFWVFGETSKTLAKIERVKLVNNRIEIFISDIERVFETGEFVKIVDVNLNDVYFDADGQETTSDIGEILSGKILGTISSINIDQNKRGNYYLSGDPVVIHGGIDDELTGIGAIAEVGEVTPGSIQRVVVEDGSYGYREDPNTFIYITPDSGKPIIRVGTVNPANTINVSVAVSDTIELKKNIILNCNVVTGWPLDSSNSYCFAATNAASIISNSNTVMANAFSYRTFSTYSIDSIIVENGGGGFVSKPTLKADSVYETDIPFGLIYDPRYKKTANTVASLSRLGILGPILFRSNTSGYLQRGSGYKVGDEIKFTGGAGSLAFANVTSVLSGGVINTISYYTKTNNPTAFGGLGYFSDSLPTLSIVPTTIVANTTLNSVVVNVASPLGFVSSSNVFVGQSISGNGIISGTTVSGYNIANNTIYISNNATANYTSNSYSISGVGADIYVSTVLGDSAKLSPVTDRIGSISTLKITNYGEDYSTEPTVSIKVQDIAIINVLLSALPQKGDIVYQGANSSSFTYKAFVDSVTRISYDEDPFTSTYILRVYDYNKSPNPNITLTLQKTNLLVSNTFSLSIKTDYVFPQKTLPNGSTVSLGQSGILTYGDGTAKATAKFLNGLILGQGRYIDESHQPSSYSLLENEIYNNFTYITSVEKEISKYRDLVYKSLHPAGTRLLGQTIIKNEIDSDNKLVESTYVDSLQDSDYIWAALATEESEENEFTSELMRFPESIIKYATLKSNNSNVLVIDRFPQIFPTYRFYGNGIPWGTTITSIDLANSTITLSSVVETTQNNTPFLAQEFWQENNNFPTPYEIVYGNTIAGSNSVTIEINNILALEKISVGQIIVGNSSVIYANTVNNSNILANVESVSQLVNGQYIYGKYIPNGTTISNIDTVNNTITMSSSATGNANGWTYNTRDPVTGDLYSVYKYNYIQFRSVPENTKISNIISSNNTVILTNNCIKSNDDNLYYFLGDGNGLKDGENSSEFIRVESGQFVEKYGTVGGASLPSQPEYFTTEQQLLTEDDSDVVTENDISINTVINIKIR